jgi:hypothetical protein
MSRLLFKRGNIMAAVVVGLCSFPLFNFPFSIPGLPSIALPPIPIITIDLDLTCPLN